MKSILAVFTIFTVLFTASAFANGDKHVEQIPGILIFDGGELRLQELSGHMIRVVDTQGRPLGVISESDIPAFVDKLKELVSMDELSGVMKALGKSPKCDPGYFYHYSIAMCYPVRSR